MAVAVALDASFAARTFSGDGEKAVDIIKQAIGHEGFAVVDILQPCVSFNKINTYKWFKENTYYLDSSHDPYDRAAAFKKAVEPGKIPLGVIYKNDGRLPFENTLAAYEGSGLPLYERELNTEALLKLIGLKKQGAVQE